MSSDEPADPRYAEYAVRVDGPIRYGEDTLTCPHCGPATVGACG